MKDNMTPNQREEIDISYLIRKIRDEYQNLLLSVFRFFMLMIKYWYIVLGVIALGIGVGYFMERRQKPQSETTLLVQINADAVTYVYDAIKQLKIKNEKDNPNDLLEFEGKLKDFYTISKVDIEPIPDVEEILHFIQEYNKDVPKLMGLSKSDEDLLMSDMFASKYKLHRITLKTLRAENSNNTIPLLLNYLNNNDAYTELQEKAVKNLEFQIDETKKSVMYLDSLMLSNSRHRIESANNVLVNNTNFTNLHAALERKGFLLESLQEMDTDLYRTKQGIVSLINKPVLRETKRLLDRKMLLMPILFFIFFVIAVSASNLYKKLKKMESEAN